MGRQERDGQSPIRSDDLYFGGTSTDWVNLSKVAIPQADEQQRLLANLIRAMNRDKKPLPRFWYFPRSLKAVVIGTGDDHGNGGTAGRFDQYAANSPAGCVGRPTGRACGTAPTSTPARRCRTQRGRLQQPAASRSACTRPRNCADCTPASLAGNYATQLAPGAEATRACRHPVTQPAALHRLQRLVLPAEDRAGQRHAAGRQLLLLARILGRRTGPAS